MESLVKAYANVLKQPKAKPVQKISALKIDPDNLALIDQINDAIRASGGKPSQRRVTNSILRAALTNPKVAELIRGDLVSK